MSATLAALVVSALPSLPLPPAQRRDTSARFVLETTVTTRYAHVGDPVPFRVADSFVIDGVGIVAGSRAEGVIVDASRPGRIHGRGTLAIEIVSVERADGTPLRVSGTIVALPPAPPRRLPADVEGPILLGMAAGYATAAVVSKSSMSAETIAGAGIAAGLTTGILTGVLRRGEDLMLSRGAVIDVPISRTPAVH
jgi:hypothetical protein